jgi:hypothetical protein
VVLYSALAAFPLPAWTVRPIGPPFSETSSTRSFSSPLHCAGFGLHGEAGGDVSTSFSAEKCPLHWAGHHLAAIIIPGQSGTYRHLQDRVTGLLTEACLSWEQLQELADGKPAHRGGFLQRLFLDYVDHPE